MAAYSIWIVSPTGYIHSRCFDEVALGLREAFLALGHAARIVTSAADIEGQPIVLGANLLAALKMEAPAGAILYNLEQISPESTWLSAEYLSLLKRHPVWDYSRRNIAMLAERDISAVLCGVGYVPALTRIQPAANKDLDVCFIGSINDRRRHVLQRLQGLGVKLAIGSGLYGADRDAVFSRSRIVLNLHFYEAQVLEIVRVSYLLANRICVVSETGRDPELEAPLADGVAFAPYQDLAQTCVALIGDDLARDQLAQRGFERFSAISQIAQLKAALEETASRAPAG